MFRPSAKLIISLSGVFFTFLLAVGLILYFKTNLPSPPKSITVEINLEKESYVNLKLFKFC